MARSTTAASKARHRSVLSMDAIRLFNLKKLKKHTADQRQITQKNIPPDRQ
jgi:hypothetical protein